MPSDARQRMASVLGHEIRTRYLLVTPGELRPSGSSDQPFVAGSRFEIVQATSRMSPTRSPSSWRVAVRRPSSMPASSPVSRRRTSTFEPFCIRSMVSLPRRIRMLWIVRLSVSGIQVKLCVVRSERPSGFKTLVTRRL